MARGLTREQIGVTEEMIATFGDIVFRMSHNYQERSGDPVRMLDWAEIERQKEDMGLTDQQIGDKLGLTRNQVLFIRTVMERRKFRTGHHARLLELGGGKRFRAERFTPELNHFRYGEAALALRAAMRFDPERAREYVRRGFWRDDTIRNGSRATPPSGPTRRPSCTRPPCLAGRSSPTRFRGLRVRCIGRASPRATSSRSSFRTSRNS